MSKDFYDKVAGQFGRYSPGFEAEKEFSNGIPEEDFKVELLKLKGNQKEVLDVGCADGRFTLSMAPYFGNILAIDFSAGMLGSAQKAQKEAGITNVVFSRVDLYHNTLPSGKFDVVYSRRGPTDYIEFFRLLKPEGHYIEIEIGENDTRQIKEIFGRGQGFGKWNISVLEDGNQKLNEAGFKVTFSKEYSYNEYYSTIADLDKFLQSVPIFEDYDSIKDKPKLEEYVSLNTTPKGIVLPRHRVVFAAEKK